MAERYDVAVVGGGPGGYPAAIRAAQLGARVALVEEDRLGGECTNYGCIPTKAMVRPLEAIHRAASLSFTRGGLEVDFEALMEWVGSVVSQVSGGVETLLKGYDVEVIRGRARLVSSTALEVDGGKIWANRIVIATGTSPSSIPGLSVDGEVVHNNRTILGLRRKPGSMLIIGGGYIGVEYANVMAKLGVEVSIVEMMPRLLPGMDKDLARVAQRRLKKLGVEVHTNTMVKEIKTGEGGAVATLSSGVKLEAEKVLVAVGRRPNTRGLGLENAGVSLDERGYIRVDDGMATSNPRIYASGDVAGPPLLAHKAFLQGAVAGENAAGGDAVYQPRAVPAVVYTEPELASVGYTLDEAREAGFNAGEKRYPLGGLAMARIEDATDGMIKLVYDVDSQQILGVHIAAPHAGEIIAGLTLALEYGATLEDLALTIHPHPSIVEAVREAAELVLGKPIHYILRRG
ncbi:MAG: dihydrolipoyl dehydrogenase [Desulfurococcales archaeon]|nr:dihydrolipoyl dehydrogenase [Desulfurococcales archaeon]